MTGSIEFENKSAELAVHGRVDIGGSNALATAVLAGQLVTKADFDALETGSRSLSPQRLPLTNEFTVAPIRLLSHAIAS